jgi:hypothetical protein
MDLIGKRIIPEKMEVIYSRPFTDKSVAEDFDIRGGEWRIEDGWLTGKNPLNAPGMIISRAEYCEDVLLDFRARTVLPSTHDIDVMWNGSWDFDTNTRGVAYVAGINGWWDSKVGIEKSPDYGLNAASRLFLFEPGRIYHVQCGSVAGHIFLIIDGVLALEATDPSPIDTSKHGLVGFEAYASHIQITDFKIKRASFIPVQKEYPPEF